MWLKTWLICLSFLYPTVAYGQPSNLLVHSGQNLITLTLRNKVSQPANELTISTLEEELPAWLKLQPTTIPLSFQEDTQEITFPLTVIDAPENSKSFLPLLLTDEQGRTWEARIEILVRASAITENKLLPNTPNPFNPETIIHYQLSGSESRHTTLIIYNALGQNVRTLVDGAQASGRYRVTWNGKDDLGREVASGVYLYKLVSGHFNQTRQMVFLK